MCRFSSWSNIFIKNQTALMEVESFFIAVVRWIPINEAEIV